MMSRRFSMESGWALGIVLLIALCLFFFRLGDRSFRNPDEGRYAEIAREMSLGGHWAEPTLYGIDYLRKPPLFYWLIAGSFRIFGACEFTARLVPALFGVLGILAACLFSRAVFGPRASFFAGMALLANIGFVQIGRFLVIDMVFSFFVTAALYLFYLAHSGDKHKTFYYCLFYVSVALAFLSKGFLAFLITGAPIFCYLAITRQMARTFSEARIYLGVLIMALIIGPWLVIVSARKPLFWDIFFFREHWQRAVAQTFEHQEAWYYYLPVTLIFLIPWVLIWAPLKGLPSALRRNGKKNAHFFLLIASCSMIVILSVSKSKLPTYILPAFPGFAALVGDGWSRWSLGHQTRERLFFGLAAFMIGGCLAATVILEITDTDYTTKHLVAAMTPKLYQNAEFFVYDHPGPFYDFAFYLNRPVRVVGLQGEFEIMAKDSAALAASVTRERFGEMVTAGKKIFCVMRRSDYTEMEASLRERFSIIAEDKRKVLLGSARGQARL